jgi:hypothetical protein
MAQAPLKSCFISAPFGADTSTLRKALEERGIRWRDETSFEPGSSWLETLDRELSDSDFICSIVPADSQSNTFFELGVAWAKRKPILAFVGPPVELPSDLVSLTYVRSDPTNPEAVRLALDTFLKHARRRPHRLTRPPSSRVEPKKKATKNISPTTGLEFEQQTAELLRQAGFIVSDLSAVRDQGADFAIWIDELEHSLGSPLLVEVKSGEISVGKLREAASELRQYVAKTHGRSALLVYWDRHNREFVPVSTEWPLILQLSGETLTALVSQGRLVQELIRLRNAAVHGGV